MHAWSQEDAAEMLAECIEAFEALAQDHDLKKAAKFARMLNNHSFGILTAWKHRISTGPLEGVNTRANLIKRIGYGYKSFEYFALKLKAARPAPDQAQPDGDGASCACVGLQPGSGIDFGN